MLQISIGITVEDRGNFELAVRCLYYELAIQWINQWIKLQKAHQEENLLFSPLSKPNKNITFADFLRLAKTFQQLSINH